MAAFGSEKAGPLPEERTVSAEFGSSDGAARSARDACRSLRTSVGRRHGDLELIVTELITNSVQHVQGESSIGLEVVVDETHARVEVSDRGSGFAPPAPAEFDLAQTGGWGLVMVDRLSESWGVFVDGGTHVWANLRHEAGGAC